MWIPIINNFLEKSKDLCFSDPEKYAYFDDVYETIRELAVCKNYYAFDLFNIKDILSLLEMRSRFASQAPAKNLFVRYIADVIKAYTPVPSGPTDIGKHWSIKIFSSPPWNHYGVFCASFMDTAFQKINKGAGLIEYSPCENAPRVINYSVISLNYDLIFETVAVDLEKNFQIPNYLRRQSDNDNCATGLHGYLAKLHGSVDTGDIIPPTWNKILGEGNILEEWHLAHHLLMNANHVRILGYSLPDGDNYIRYLLGASIVHNKHLKSFDVLCLDWDGSVKQRYEKFVKFPKFRITPKDVMDYLNKNLHFHNGAMPENVSFDNLEKTHENFF